MEKDKEVTEVIFKKFRVKDGGQVIAIFPYMFESMYSHDQDTVGSYMHVGQHSTCSYASMSLLQPAKAEEYKDLKDELENHVGYNLKVIRRRNYKTTDKKHQEYIAQRAKAIHS